MKFLFPMLAILWVGAFAAGDSAAQVAPEPNPDSDQPVVAPAANRLGVCRVINRETDIYPTGSATTFMYDFVYPRDHTNFSVDAEGKPRTDTVVEIVEPPAHGRLVPETTASRNFRKYNYKYVADEGFVGTERFVINVSVEGVTVQIDYELDVNPAGVTTKNQSGNGHEPCPKEHWLMSLGENVDGSRAGAGVDPQSDAEEMPFQPTPKADERGFIDVWQLREDVIAVEALVAYEFFDEFCYEEWGTDEELSASELERIERQEDECIAEAKKAFEIYTRVHRSFNDAWLPLMREAIDKGDKVAEVIMRQCETTSVLERDWIESTCDRDPDRLATARQRLREIDFVPAVDIGDEVFDDRGNSMIQRGKNQVAALKKVRAGALGHDRFLVAMGGNTVDNVAELEIYRRSSLMEAAIQDAPRAFSFSPPSSDGRTGAFKELRLNREPATPGALTWGQYLHGGGNSIWTGPYYWRFGPRKIFISGHRQTQIVAGPDVAEFMQQRQELLDEIESNIDAYLAEDPRWSVFLLHRVGHHEWVPEGMTSDTGNINDEWLGEWVLQDVFEEKAYLDWGSLKEPVGGTTARISRSGDATYVSFQSQTPPSSPIGDAGKCQLRYSGGLTYIPSQHPRSSVSNDTVLGYLSPEPIEGLVDVFKPLDPTKRYKQVLVQCPEGESPDNNRTRFLLLAEDTMVEVATDRYAIRFVRHFRRVR